MTSLFLDGFGDDFGAIKALNESPTFPLVRELVFKYGLRVVRPTANGWLMAHQNGIAVGKAFWSKDADSQAFTWRSPYYTKQRGADRTDKETIRSKNLSTMMSVLKSKNVIPTAAEMVERKLKMLQDPIRLMKRSFGSSDKNVSIKGDDLHALLAHYFQGEFDSRGLSIDRNLCKNLLDDYDKADTIRRMKSDKCKAFFTKPFYMAGVDEFGDWLIGKVQLETLQSTPTLVEGFKRYKSIEGYPELIPFVTMTKLAYEAKNHIVEGIPITDEYNEALDAVFFFQTRPTHYDHTYVVTPC